MIDVFSIGMRSTQLSESMNNALKGHLKSDLDIIRFLKRVEHVVQDKREKEVQSEFESRKKQPRIGMMAPMLLQAYTVSSNGTNEFVIAIGALGGKSTIEEERKVIVNPVEQMVPSHVVVNSLRGLVYCVGMH